MGRKFRVIASVPDAKATAALQAVKKFRKRVDARFLDDVGQVAAGSAIEAKASRFIAPINRYGHLCFDVCESMQSAANTAFMNHIGAVQVIEIAADLTVTHHFIEAE